MGVYYYIYAEVRVGNKWYNISPLMRDREGEVKVRPVLHGQSWIRQAFEKMADDCQYRGLPKDVSEELRTIFPYGEDEKVEGLWEDMTYGEYYGKTLLAVNYWAHIKGCVKENIPTRYRGYVNKYHLAAYEIGEEEDITNWIHPTKYEQLSEEQKKEYVYYEWNGWQDWYAVYTELVKRVDCLLDFFKDWYYYQVWRADWPESNPTIDSVRLIVERS